MGRVRQVLPDLADGVADAARDIDPGAFGRRARGSPAPAQAEGPGQFALQCVLLLEQVFHPCLVVHLAGFLQRLPDFAQAPAVGVARLGIQARAIDAEDRRPANLVFVIDVSRSMGLRPTDKPNPLDRGKQVAEKLVTAGLADDRTSMLLVAVPPGWLVKSGA